MNINIIKCDIMKVLDRFNLKKSMGFIGQLYPVLLDATGQYVIDGVHRLKADPNWPKVKLSQIKHKEQILVARIIANMCRRELSVFEKSEMFNQLAEILRRERNISTGEIAKTISKMTGISYRTVARYLSHKFKDMNMARRKKAVAKLATIKIDEAPKLEEIPAFPREERLVTDEKGNVILLKAVFKPNERTGFHYHSSNSYLYCLEGEGKCQVGAPPSVNEVDLYRGIVVYVSKLSPHQIVNIGSEKMEVVSFYHPPIKKAMLYLEDKNAW